MTVLEGAGTVLPDAIRRAVAGTGMAAEQWRGEGEDDQAPDRRKRLQAWFTAASGAFLIAGAAVAFLTDHDAAGIALWYLTLLTGFWILYSTQLSIMDLLPRTLTDILWTSNRGVRTWAGGDVRRVYYGTWWPS